MQNRTLGCVLAWAMLFTAFFMLSARAETGKVQYKAEGPETGEKWWERQIIHTSLFDVDAGGAIALDYGGVWSKEDEKRKGLKCVIKPNYGNFPISIEEKTPLSPLVKVRQGLLDTEHFKVVDIEQHVYRYEAGTECLVLARCGTGGKWGYVGATLNGKAVERIEKWPNIIPYAVELKKGDVLEIKSQDEETAISVFYFVDDQTSPANADDKDPVFLGERKRYEVRKRRMFSSTNSPYLSNTSFELGIKDWELAVIGEAKGANWETTKDESYHGKHSLKIECWEAGPIISLTSRPIQLSSNKEYTVSFYAKGTGMWAELTYDPYQQKKYQVDLSSEEWKRHVVKLTSEQLHWDIVGYKQGSFALDLGIKGEGFVYLDAFQMEETGPSPYKMPAEVEIGLSDGSKNNIHHLGDKVNLTVNVFNGKETAVEPTVTYQVKDFYHNVVQEGKFNCVLGPAGSLDKKIRLKLKGTGIFWVRAVLEGNDRKDVEANIAVINPLTKRDYRNTFFVGSCLPHQNQEAVLSLTKEIGMSAFTVYGSAGMFFYAFPENWKEQLKEGKLKFNADRFIELGQRYKLPLWVGTVGGVPTWIKGVENIWRPLPKEMSEEITSEWADIMSATVNHYKSGIKHWDIWGEMIGDRETARKIVALLKKAYPAAKKADPDCIVMADSFTMGHNWTTFKNLKYFSEEGGLDYVDAVSIHPYHDPYSPEEIGLDRQIARMKEILKKYNKKQMDIYQTECGFLAANTYCTDVEKQEDPGYYKILSEEAQADYIVRANIISKACGIKLYSTFIMQGGSIRMPFLCGLTYGLCSSPKAVVAAYNTMADLLTESSFVERIRLGQDLRCYVFARSGDYVTCIWNASGTKGKTEARLPLGKKRVKIVNLMGNPVSPDREGKDLIIHLDGGSPVFLITKDNYLSVLGKEDETGNPKIEARLFPVGPAERMEADVGNLGTNIVATTVKAVEIPAGWKLSGAGEQEAVLAPNEKKKVVFPLKEMDLSSGRKDYRIRVETFPQGTFMEINPLFSVFRNLPPSIDGNLDDWKGITPISLGREEFGCVSGMPASGENNPNSALIYTGWDNDFFYFAAEVTDDKFNQPYTGDKIWAGDSIQIGFDPLNNAEEGNGYEKDDYEYTLGLTEKGPEIYGFHNEGKVDERATKEIKLMISKKGNQICYEAAFPWSTLSSFIPDPEKGEAMGFALTIMDNEEEKHTQKWLALGNGIVTGKDPSKFKKMFLIRND